MALAAKQKKFVQEYLVDLNATQAAIRAGYSAKTANEQGARLLANVSVQTALKTAMNKRAARTEITADMVLQRWWAIATADPNELIAHRRVCCRYCFGKDHEYQWADEDEYDRQVRLAQDLKQPVPTDYGGYGFDPTIRPHPKCPKCHGEGHGDIMAADTRDLSPQARMLYAGVKTTKDGMEIKLQDQGKALENVARHLGMFKDKLELSGGVDVNNPYAGLTTEELKKLIGSG
ncbi:terminase small subunit [Cohnella sp. GbtcB17]|uniref:terminase small subunit n=1 Tax=Cohnella sp. GbtcB17 TaxID=2824762 RepID=UPI001C309D7B|nr:terminase small subunit [Cohnella sp. GbtcB17]